MTDRNNALAKLVIGEARGLRTEDGSNPEYDRALVELTCRVLGYSCADDGARIAIAIGIDPTYWEA